MNLIPRSCTCGPVRIFGTTWIEAVTFLTKFLLLTGDQTMQIKKYSNAVLAASWLRVREQCCWAMLGFSLLALAACGGGGGESSGSSGGANATTATAAIDSPSNYTCDKTVALSSAPRTSAFEAVYPPITIPTASLTTEQWSLSVGGEQNTLNVVIAKPDPSISIRGIVVVGHGNSAANSTQSPLAMVDQTLVSQMASRGLIVFFVARRGNYGSTGARLFTVTNDLLSQYGAGKLVYADIESLTTKFQSDSLVAAMDQKIANDPVYRPFINTVLVIGASGGANTVLQTAADSSVFKAAINKGIIRLTGLDSAFDTNPDALPGVSQFGARIAPGLVPSLWIGGEADTTTSPGQLACMFNAFNKAAGFPNTFYLVPGLGHLGFSAIFTTSLIGTTSQYLVGRRI